MKNKKAWKIIANIAEWGALVLLGLFALARFYNYIDTKNGSHHPLFGRKETVIISGSMSYVNNKNAEELKDCKDQIQINDVIVTTNRISYESLEVHDVILFRSSKGDICHRIIKKYVTDDKKQMLVTRGDANEIADDAFEYTCVIGKVVRVKPKAGFIVNFFNSPYFLLGVSISVGFVVAGVLISEIGKDKRKKAEENAGISENSQENILEIEPAKKVEEKPIISENNAVKPIEKRKPPVRKTVEPKEKNKETPIKDNKGRFVSNKPKEGQQKEAPKRDNKGRFV